LVAAAFDVLLEDRCLLVFAEGMRIADQVVGRSERGGVVVAEDAASTVEDVLIHATGLVSTGSRVRQVGGGEAVRVVLVKDTPPPVEGVLGEGSDLIVLAERSQVPSEVFGRTGTYLFDGDPKEQS
jgi:hypothetical protein